VTQLQRDLESLLGEVDAGWSNMNGVATGRGGCVLDGMYRAVYGTEYGTQHSPECGLRIDAMVTALGFTEWAMYEWNDAQTDPNEIKLRIKDALNNL
jgi:hypothetical protein